MKIIQQDFKAASRLWFVLSTALLLTGVYGIIESDYVTIGKIIINAMMGIFMVCLFGYGSYQLSFAYEFKKTELIVCSLFGLLGKKSYSFKDLKKIELSVWQNRLDEIHLYFESRGSKRKLSVNRLQVDLGMVRLFLFANIENFEDILVENERG